jgi:NADH-quinone oxidoreductase subunit M
VILAAVYMLWMFQRVMFGKITNEENLHMTDLNGREIAYLLPLLVMIFWIGVYPQTFLRKMDASVNAAIARIETKRQAALSSRPAGEPLLVRYFDIDAGK